MEQKQLEEMYLCMNLFDRGIVSKKTILEKMGINAEEEEKRRSQEASENEAKITDIEGD
jgi:hypothetical protein